MSASFSHRSSELGAMGSEFQVSGLGRRVTGLVFNYSMSAKFRITVRLDDGSKRVKHIADGRASRRASTEYVKISHVTFGILSFVK